MDAIAERRAPRNQGASNCRWATSTLFLEAPFWFEAEADPWTCVCQEPPRLLRTTELCATCRRWEPHARPERR